MISSTNSGTNSNANSSPSPTITAIDNNLSSKETRSEFSGKNPGIKQLLQLSDDWLELESDPGLFTLLIRDFGCFGAEVKEIYDLQKSFTDQVYGFIFLYNVIEEHRKSNLGNANPSNTSPSILLSGDYITDDEVVNKMFFAYQKVPNSCATHAILSVLMNSTQLEIGPTLKRLQLETKNMSPDNKGYAISNMAELARAHNFHAGSFEAEDSDLLKQHPNPIRASQRNFLFSDAYHFVSFVPINGRLIELDGLKEYPIDHGLIQSNELWTDKFFKLIRKRIETSKNADIIHYNLMAVIPSKFYYYQRLLKSMERHRIFLLRIMHFFEFNSSVNLFNEHNYIEFDSKEQNFASSINLKNQTNIEYCADSKLFENNESDNYDLIQEFQEPEFSSSSTDTASDACSLYNFDEDMDFKGIDGSYNTFENCKKFFICKFGVCKTDSSNPTQNKKLEGIFDQTSNYSFDFNTIKEVLNLITTIIEGIETNSINKLDCLSSVDYLMNIYKETAIQKNERVTSLFNDINCNYNNEKMNRMLDWLKQSTMLIDKQIDSHPNLEKQSIQLDQNWQFVKNCKNTSSLATQNNNFLSSMNFSDLFELILQKFQLQRNIYEDVNLNLKPFIMKDLSRMLTILNEEIIVNYSEYEEKNDKWSRYTLDDTRRTYDYEDLILAFLTMVLDQDRMYTHFKKGKRKKKKFKKRHKKNLRKNFSLKVDNGRFTLMPLIPNMNFDDMDSDDELDFDLDFELDNDIDIDIDDEFDLDDIDFDEMDIEDNNIQSNIKKIIIKFCIDMNCDDNIENNNNKNDDNDNDDDKSSNKNHFEKELTENYLEQILEQIVKNRLNDETNDEYWKNLLQNLLTDNDFICNKMENHFETLQQINILIMNLNDNVYIENWQNNNQIKKAIQFKEFEIQMKNKKEIEFQIKNQKNIEFEIEEKETNEFEREIFEIDNYIQSKNYDENVDEKFNEKVDEEFDEEFDEEIDDQFDEEIDDQFDEEIDDEFGEEIDEEDDKFDEEFDKESEDEFDEEIDQDNEELAEEIDQAVLIVLDDGLEFEDLEKNEAEMIDNVEIYVSDDRDIEIEIINEKNFRILNTTKNEKRKINEVDEEDEEIDEEGEGIDEEDEEIDEEGEEIDEEDEEIDEEYEEIDEEEEFDEEIDEELENDSEIENVEFNEDVIVEFDYVEEDQVYYSDKQSEDEDSEEFENSSDELENNELVEKDNQFGNGKKYQDINSNFEEIIYEDKNVEYEEENDDQEEDDYKEYDDDYLENDNYLDNGNYEYGYHNEIDEEDEDGYYYYDDYDEEEKEDEDEEEEISLVVDEYNDTDTDLEDVREPLRIMDNIDGHFPALTFVVPYYYHSFNYFNRYIHSNVNDDPDAGSNANSDSNSNSDIESFVNLNADSDAESNVNSYSNSDFNSNTDSDLESNESNSYSDADSNTGTDGESNINGKKLVKKNKCHVKFDENLKLNDSNANLDVGSSSITRIGGGVNLPENLNADNDSNKNKFKD